MKLMIGKRLLRWCIWSSIFILIFFVLITSIILIIPIVSHSFYFFAFVKDSNVNYADLASFNLTSVGRNFYIDVEDGVRIGCWHILPSKVASEVETNNTDERFEELLSSPEHRVILYLHGIKSDRTYHHRRQLYNVLADNGYHIVAIDYRGYGDSTGSPTEDGVIRDSKEAINYLLNFVQRERLFIWGHSLGAGIAVGTVAQLSEASLAPSGLILESPFDTFRSTVYSHWIISRCTKYTLIRLWINLSLWSAGPKFDSAASIAKVDCPILILHAADDYLIPLKLGKALYQAAIVASRIATFIEFDSSNEFKHKFIYKSDILPSIIKKFTTKSKKIWYRRSNDA